MDVTEKRKPHDGRRLYRRDDGSLLDLRINTLPTLHGEDFSLRLLERESALTRAAAALSRPIPWWRRLMGGFPIAGQRP